jgi:ABC-type molybdate transport system substrate-binding protein
MPDPDAVARRPVSKAGRDSRDLRLVLGVLLVIGSVAGVYGIVATADRRVTVYAAAAALTPGVRFAAAEVVQRSVSLVGSFRL